MFHASWPLVELQATPDALTFTLRFGFGRIGSRRIAGPWVARRAEVISIRPILGMVLQQMRFEFHLVDNQVWMFMSMKPQDVLPCLQQLGYPVRPPSKD
jgi:hypothetical protein